MKDFNNISDDELDKLFKQATNEENDSFSGEAWSKMEQLLDSNKPDIKAVFWKKNAYWALALLFLAGISIYFLNNNGNKKLESAIANNNNEPNIRKTKNNSQSNNTNKIDSRNSNITLDTINTNAKQTQYYIENKAEKEVIEKNEANKKGIKNENRFAETSILDRQLVASVEKNTLRKTKKHKPTKKISSTFFNNNISKTNEFENENNQKIKSNSNNKYYSERTINQLAIGTKGETNSIKTKEEAQTIENIYFENAKNSETFPNLPNSKNSNKPIDNQAINQLEKIENNKLFVKSDLQKQTFAPLLARQSKLLIGKFVKNIEIQKPTLPIIINPEYFKKGLYLSANYSPDISTVGSNEVNKIGSNLGLFLEYRFSKRLSLQAGIFRSMKYYDAYPEQYDWVWGKPVTPLKEITAQCKMMDYPINIRYDFTQNTKSRIFSTAGLTTYKMMEETYDYDYEDNTNPSIKWHQWKGKTGKTFLTSNLNLSLGFEKQLAKKLSIQIEPFAKVPLKNIGFGKIPLISYGLMFSGKLAILTHKK